MLSEISTDKTQEETSKRPETDSERSHMNINQEMKVGPEATNKAQVIEEKKRYYLEEGEVQNMSPPIGNLNYPPPRDTKETPKLQPC